MMTNNQQPWVIGNWKLNPATATEAVSLVWQLQEKLGDVGNRVNVAIAPSFIHLHSISHILSGSPIRVFGQDVTCHTATTGAFTGDVSATQVADVGASGVLIGHSECRQYYGETNQILAQKMQHAHHANLGVVLCIGETQAQYQAGDTLQVLGHQLAVLADSSPDFFDKLIIAYEPVWAIGTGLTPTIDQVEQVHQYIKQTLQHYTNKPIAVLYGGSVNDKNAHQFAQSDWVDGVLVGGASLKADSFVAIVQSFASAS